MYVVLTENNLKRVCKENAIDKKRGAGLLVHEAREIGTSNIMFAGDNSFLDLDLFEDNGNDYTLTGALYLKVEGHVGYSRLILIPKNEQGRITLFSALGALDHFADLAFLQKYFTGCNDVACLVEWNDGIVRSILMTNQKIDYIAANCDKIMEKNEDDYNEGRAARNERNRLERIQSALVRKADKEIYTIMENSDGIKNEVVTTLVNVMVRKKTETNEQWKKNEDEIANVKKQIDDQKRIVSRTKSGYDAYKNAKDKKTQVLKKRKKCLTFMREPVLLCSDCARYSRTYG